MKTRYVLHMVGLGIILTLILAWLLPWFINARDGSSCNSKSVEESRANGLFVATYSILEAPSLIDTLIKEAWIEKNCVYEGSDPTVIPNFRLFLRLGIHITGDPEFANQYGVWKVEQAERWFDVLGDHQLETYFPSRPLVDTLRVHIRNGYWGDSVRVVDSFLLVRDYLLDK